MRKIIIITSLLLSIVSLKSQENFSMEPNKVTQYEMDMTEYSKDNDAEALVIYSKGNYRFIFEQDEGFLLEMTTHTKIKILSQAGEKYAAFEIPIYRENSRRSETLESVEGITYNLEKDGMLTKVELDPKNIFEEQINEKWFRKKFTLPNIRTGSVLEVKYTIRTPYFINMRTWELQKKIPVLHSSLQYRAIPYYEYVFNVNGVNQLDEFTSNTDNSEIRHGRLVYSEVVHTLGLNDIPAFRDEQFISSEKDYMIAIKFQLSRIHHPNGGKREYISTWEALCDDLLKDSNYGKYINSSKKEARKILPSLDLENKTDLEKVKIITEYVKNNYNWDGYYGKYSSQKITDLLKKKSGNVADINLFLVGLLQEARIDVNPIVSSTRENGMINKNYPFLHLLNYTLVEVTIDDRKYYIDATEPLLGYNIVPRRSINTQALVVKPKSEEWTFISQRQVSYLQKNFKITFHDEDKKLINVNASYGASGNDAYTYRVKYLGKDENLISYLKDTEKISTINNIEIKPSESLEKPFLFTFDFENTVEQSSNKIFVNPFCNLQPKENPFKQKDRTLPIDLTYLINRRYNSQIIIPEGYVVEHLPEEFNTDDNIMRVTYSASVDENTNRINVQALYAFMQNVYDADSYEALKISYNQMLSKFSEMIVLSKK